MRIAGLATGMDINQIVNDLMSAERMPMNKLFREREWLNWQRDAYREVNLALRNFRDTFSNMRLQSTFIGLQASSSNELGLKVSAGASAIAGTYSIEIEQLAKGAQLPTHVIKDQNEDPVQASTNIFEAMGRDAGAGDLKIKIAVSKEGGAAGSWREAEITITHQDTFASLAQKLDRATVVEDGKNISLGVQASFDNTLGSFFITTKETGEHVALKFEAGDNDNGFGTGDGEISFEDFMTKYLLGPGAELDGDNVEEAGPDSFIFKGQNAKGTFDGMAFSQATNTVSVRGLTLNLSQTGEYTVSVQADPDRVFDQIKKFVDEYNELIDMLNGKLNETRYRDYPPLTDEEREALTETEAKRWDERAQSGLLRNDPLLREVLINLRQAWMNPIEGIPSGELRQLAQIGISTTTNWNDGGKLEINETRLREAIAERPEEVMALFTQAPQEDGNKEQMGIGRRIYQTLNETMGRLTEKAGVTGVTVGDQSILGEQLKDINDRLLRWEDRLSLIEERYWRQFTAMEKAVQQMNEQSMFLINHFYGMNSMGGF